MELAIAALNARLPAGRPMTSISAQDGRGPPTAFVGHEREFSELHIILADVAKAL
jgi:hypothetical protein